MNAPAFTTPCGTALSSRTAFSGLAVRRCESRAAQLCVTSRPIRMSPRMLSTPPEEPAEDVAPIEAVEESPVDVGSGAATATLDPESEGEGTFEMCEPPKHVLNDRLIKEAQQKFKLHETDSGSPEFQIATLTTRITYLTDHLKNNSKDFSSTRGLIKMVATRRRLLKFLKREDPKRFTDIIEGLNIRVSQQLRDL